MRSAKIQWVVAFKQKQWVSEEVFQNIIQIQTYNWTMCALCKSTLSGGLQAEAMASRSFLKHYTHANIQLNKVCALWNYTVWLASSRSNGIQKKIFRTLYIFKHTIEQNMHSDEVQWVLGFKHQQRLSEEIFWNNIHIQTCNWTKYALCQSTLSSGLQAEARAFRGSFLKDFTHSNIQLTKYAFCECTLSGGPQAEAMGFRKSFSKLYTHSNIQLNNVCALLKFTDWWDSSRSNDLQKKFYETLYTFKHTLKQSMTSVKVHWVVGFKQKQRVSGEVFQTLIHIQTNNWTM